MSDTGRYYFQKDGRTFYVEPLDANAGRKKNWGDIDPATKKITGHYGEKHPGAIHPDDSIITEENGFKNIMILPPGVSPDGFILDLIEKEKNAKK